MPQAAAGTRIEPPVSVPIVAIAIPVPTDTADPPLDPPALRDVSIGLRTAPKALTALVVPNANSWRLVFPTSTAPAAFRRDVTSASEGAGCSARTREAAVVGTP